MRITVSEAVAAFLMQLISDKIANERRKLHWRERLALWLGKHVRRWERV